MNHSKVVFLGLALGLLFVSVSTSSQVSVGFYFRYNYPYWDYYGRWIWLPGYGDVWSPYVWYDWTPYYYGVWVWDPYYGWVWYSYEPWGWVTYHYGWWIWHPVYGWCWVPTRRWAPARVAWIDYGVYIGWVPLAPDDRPYYYSIPKHHHKKYKYPHQKDFKFKGVIMVEKESFAQGKEYKYIDIREVKEKFYKDIPEMKKTKPKLETELKWSKSPPNIKPPEFEKSPDFKYKTPSQFPQQDKEKFFLNKTEEFEKTWRQKTGGKIDIPKFEKSPDKDFAPKRAYPDYSPRHRQKDDYPFPMPKYQYEKRKRSQDEKQAPEEEPPKPQDPPSQKKHKKK